MPFALLWTASERHLLGRWDKTRNMNNYFAAIRRRRRSPWAPLLALTWEPLTLGKKRVINHTSVPDGALHGRVQFTV